MNTLVLSPRITEKAVALAEMGIYVFDVPTDTNKIEVTKAVEAAFGVKVTDVNIIIAKGKLKRFKQKLGRQSNTKKAMVKLQAGDKIALIEGAE